MFKQRSLFLGFVGYATNTNTDTVPTPFSTWPTCHRCHYSVSPWCLSPPLPHSPPLPLELYFIRFNWEYTLLEPGPLQLATSPLPSSPLLSPPLPSSLLPSILSHPISFLLYSMLRFELPRDQSKAGTAEFIGCWSAPREVAWPTSVSSYAFACCKSWCLHSRNVCVAYLVHGPDSKRQVGWFGQSCHSVWVSIPISLWYSVLCTTGKAWEFGGQIWYGYINQWSYIDQMLQS